MFPVHIRVSADSELTRAPATRRPTAQQTNKHKGQLCFLIRALFPSVFVANAINGPNDSHGPCWAALGSIGLFVCCSEQRKRWKQSSAAIVLFVCSLVRSLNACSVCGFLSVPWRR